MTEASGGAQPIRIVRVIARLNIGGPAIQAITLTKRLEPLGYRTTLVRGKEEPDEGSMDDLADALGVQPVLVSSLRRNPGWHDVAALWQLIRIIRRERPHIVHTHAAKAGTLGRVATVIAFPLRRRRPVLIHTYHGHSLTGYFSPRTASVYRRIEQLLGRVTDRLIAVAGQVRDDLVAMNVAPRQKFEVVPLGFELSPFMPPAKARQKAREALRAELDLPLSAPVVTIIARLVPIKRVDRFLQIAAGLGRPDVCFVVVGDGELRQQLHSAPEAQALGTQLRWTGFRRDIGSVCFASDVVVLTSDNEGTPVSLIEAQAAGVPVVTTDVGGVRSVVKHGETGFVEAADDIQALAQSVSTLLDDRDLAARMGAAGRQHVTRSFSLDRLSADHDRIYRRAGRRGAY